MIVPRRNAMSTSPTGPRRASLIALPLLVACGTGPKQSDNQDSTPTADSDSAGPPDSGDTSDTSVADCSAPQLLSPLATSLWIGSRYDLVLGGAVAASVAGEALPCEPVDGVLVCAYTPEAAGTVSVESGRDGCPLSEVGSLDVVAPVGVYPRGDRYMMALYEAQYTDEVATLPDFVAAGVNAVQTYDSEPGLGTWEAEAASLGLIYSRHVESEDDLAEALGDPAVGWWDLPEELRYWYPDEMTTLETLSEAARAEDDRPVYMYIPGHYRAEDIAYYVDALDLIGAGAYAEYSDQPHAWVRWRVESEIEAITLAGYTTADRTPLGVVGVFNGEQYGAAGVPDATEVVHDHLAAVAAGARGLYTFAWWHAVRDADVGDSADAILEVATRVSGEEALGEWVMRGEDLGELDVTVTSGEAELSVTPYASDVAYVYPSVWGRAWRHAGAWTVVLVNSSEEPVSAVVSGLPGSRAERVYDGVAEDASGGELTVELGRLEGRVYRIPETSGSGR